MKINALVLCCFAFVGKASSQTSLAPNLNGAHFRFTVVEDDGWVNIDEDEDGNLEFTGYCIDILDAISSGANFTYDLKPPSGFGSLCKHSEGKQSPTEPYGKEYRGQYLCGQSDVQDDKNYTISQNNYTTDFYQGLFYVTPERRLLNRFTTPFLPPSQGGMQLMGTATRIRGLEDLIKQQKEGKQGPACLPSNTAASLWIKRSFQDLKTIDVEIGEIGDIHKLLSDGTCDIMINSNPKEMRVVMKLSEEDLCKAKGKPIGLIGDPLAFGFNQFAIGVRRDIPTEVIDTIDYWMNHFMTCSPAEEDCADSFAAYYPAVGGTGYECGYDNYPHIADNWSVGAIVGVVAGVALSSLLLGWVAFYYYELLKQRKRIKKRFVQQIARNLPLGPSPDDIPTEKLAQLIGHIGGAKGSITEQDFRKWMWDINLEFLSESDLVALWKSIDSKGGGLVTPIDFIIFLRTCEREFSEVSQEVKAMSKTERLKFTARDLSDLQEVGEEGVKKKEFEITRRSRQNIQVPLAVLETE